MQWIQKGRVILNNKIEELLNAVKLNELLNKKMVKEEKKNPYLYILAAIGAIAAVASIAYLVYKRCTPDYLEDFEDDFDDDFEDDFYDDEDTDEDVKITFTTEPSNESPEA